MEIRPEEVAGLVSRTPSTVADLGLALAALHGQASPSPAEQPVGQRLAAVGLSLSGLQRVVDELVRDGRVVEVRGRELWDLGLPTTGTKAQGRYYLSPS